MTETTTLAQPLSRRLKTETQAAHEGLDSRIMESRPFASLDRYALFLGMQHQFHRDIQALYADPRLAHLVPDLAARCRLSMIEADLDDLDLQPSQTMPAVDLSDDLATRFGWLYVAEGSNLGAAFLIKEAAKLGLGEDFGARHLAASPEGRGRQWKTFQAALDDADFDEAGEARVIAGAVAAFQRVQRLAEDAFAA
ncbi:biliverdin-producing heme oxygenase [Tianweitania sp. BSSL-BM11]|uniref:Biliverdin-producing heme oxygenase n=1 Tax=Tianweitania aestuarii TaxID=2814886 RepID=A0ABS5RUH0_9HYPH|nr:biliverdin-producing heme oxygenase [Tianweitania aestuarii]MBS9720656.1 biliverdin-producing heme oxygenase [Tianweitania aestuarii]